MIEQKNTAEFCLVWVWHSLIEFLSIFAHKQGKEKGHIFMIVPNELQLLCFACFFYFIILTNVFILHTSSYIIAFASLTFSHDIFPLCHRLCLGPAWTFCRVPGGNIFSLGAYLRKGSSHCAAMDWGQLGTEKHFLLSPSNIWNMTSLSEYVSW